MANINFSLPDEAKEELEAAYQKALAEAEQEHGWRPSFSAWLVGLLRKAVRGAS